MKKQTCTPEVAMRFLRVGRKDFFELVRFGFVWYNETSNPFEFDRIRLRALLQNPPPTLIQMRDKTAQRELAFAEFCLRKSR